MKKIFLLIFILLFILIFAISCRINNFEESSVDSSVDSINESVVSQDIYADLPEYIIADEYLRYDYIYYKNFNFIIPVLTKNLTESVKLLEYEGENFGATTIITMINGTSNEISDYKRNGYYIVLLAFSGRTSENNIKITKFTIKHNDNVIEIDLKNPIKHNTNNWELCDKDTYISVAGPLAYFSWGIYTPVFDDVLSVYSYEYDIKEDIELIDIYITHSMEIIDSRILLDGEELGNIYDILPMNLDKNSKIRLDLTFWFTDDLTNYKSCEIHSNLVLLYKTKDGIEKKYYYLLNVIGITNIDDINILMDQCVQEIMK